jgi:hypothetical protein
MHALQNYIDRRATMNDEENDPYMERMGCLLIMVAFALGLEVAALIWWMTHG